MNMPNNVMRDDVRFVFIVTIARHFILSSNHFNHRSENSTEHGHDGQTIQTQLCYV